MNSRRGPKRRSWPSAICSACRSHAADSAGRRCGWERRAAPTPCSPAAAPRTALVTTRGFGDILRDRLSEPPAAVRSGDSQAAAAVRGRGRDRRADRRRRQGAACARPASEFAQQLVDAAASRHRVAGHLPAARLRPPRSRTTGRRDRPRGRLSTKISVSSQVAPLVKIVSRGDTTVVDAYLNPVLRALRRAACADRLPGSSLRILTSAGGLVDADSFVGKDSILSGPAGGVVGFSRVAQAAGFERAIGFDMGGTSTDVSRFDGRYELEYETEKAGVRIVAPDDGHRNRGGRRRLGLPLRRRQAGRRPRKRRRRSGPGLLRPRRAAGRHRRQLSARARSCPSDFPFRSIAAAVDARLEALCRRNRRRHRPALRAARTGRRLPPRGQRQHGPGDPHDLDRQGLRPARISAGRLRRRGRPTCLRRGARTGHPPGSASSRRRRCSAPTASAWPTSSAIAWPASTSALRPRSLGQLASRPSSGSKHEAVRRSRWPKASTDRADRGLAVAGPALPRRRSVARRSPARRHAADYAPRFPWPNIASCTATCTKDAQLEIVAARVEARGRSSAPLAAIAPRRAPARLRPSSTTDTWFDGQLARNGRFRSRRDLQPGDTIRGPAILCEPTSTTVIDPGWQAKSSAAANCW